MKEITIAFLYNVRHNFDPKSEESHLEVDFDEYPTVRWIIKHLKNCGYKVLPIEANQEAYLKASSMAGRWHSRSSPYSPSA